MGFIHRPKVIGPATAYDLWASSYDEQNDNPLIYLDEMVFTEMLAECRVEGKTVVDVGCGTGRHWSKILDRKPVSLTGYDVSVEMLKALQNKYPQAKTILADDNKLKELSDGSCDLLISNLVIGYMEKLEKVFSEWNRVLKTKGEIIITDFHPASLLEGGNRSFKHNNKTFTIKNYIHTLDEIKTLSGKMNWKQLNLVEKKVDSAIRHFYIKTNLDAYNKSLNVPILYGVHFRKS